MIYAALIHNYLVFIWLKLFSLILIQVLLMLTLYSKMSISSKHIPDCNLMLLF